MKLSHNIEPQFSDSDALGHANYQAVVRWFEAGRMPIYRLFAPDFEIVRQHTGLFLVMVNMSIDYVAETLVGSPVVITTRISRIGNSSFTVLQESLQDGHVCCKGSFTLVCYDFATKKSNSIPGEVRRQLEQWIE